MVLEEQVRRLYGILSIDCLHLPGINLQTGKRQRNPSPRISGIQNPRKRYNDDEKMANNAGMVAVSALAAATVLTGTTFALV